MYLKSREIGSELSHEQQGTILGKVLEEILIKAINKQVAEGALNEEDASDATEMLREYMKEWKAELE